MHSLQVISGGFALWATALLLRTMFGLQIGSGVLCVVFCLIWFVASGINMAMGMHTAGYSFSEELPFFVLVFSAPVVVAVMTVSRCVAGETRPH